MHRSDVYDAIDTERDFQDGFIANQGLTHNKTVGEFLTLIRAYSAKADSAWVGQPGDAGALEEIRKIAALCVSCMEHHGATKRSTFKPFSAPNYPTRKQSNTVGWVGVISSNVNSVLYLPSSRQLQVRFNDSAVYEYDNVPGYIYSGMLSANSKGRYFNDKIKGKFTSRRIS